MKPVWRVGLIVSLAWVAACLALPPPAPLPPRDHLMSLPSSAQQVHAHMPALPFLLTALVAVHGAHVDRSLEPLQKALQAEPGSAFIHEKLALALLATDHPSQAEAVLGRGLRMSPTDAGLNLLAGQVAMEARRFGDAVVALRQSMLDATTVASAAPLYIEALLWQGNSRQAVATAHELLLNHPADADLALTLAGILEDHEQLAMARDAYRQARAQRPSERQATLGEVRLHLLERDRQAALRALLPLLAYYPDQVELMMLAWTLGHDTHYPKAAFFRAQALRHSDQDPATLLVIAQTDAMLGQRDQALRLLRGIVQRLPVHVPSRIALARLLLQSGQGAQALEVLGRAGDVAALWEARAETFAAQGNSNDMIGAYARAARLMPDSSRLFNAAARVLLAQHGAAEVQNLLNPALEQISHNGDHAYGMAQTGVALALGDGPRALALLQGLIQVRPQDVGLQTLLADAESRFGQPAAAVSRLISLLRDDPLDPWRLNALGYTLTQEGLRLPEAAVYLRRALRLTFLDAVVADSFGSLLLAEGRADDAAFWLEEARRRSPLESEVLCHLGDAYAAEKITSKAVPLWRQALQAYPDLPLRDRLQQRLRGAHSN